MTDVRINLKVCEGCGALWLRAGNHAGVYCRSCTAALAEFPAPRGRRARGAARLARRPRTAERRRTAAGRFADSRFAIIRNGVVPGGAR